MRTCRLQEAEVPWRDLAGNLGLLRGCVQLLLTIDQLRKLGSCLCITVIIGIFVPQVCLVNTVKPAVMNGSKGYASI